MRILVTALLLASVSLAGCSMFSKSRPETPTKKVQVMEFLDAGRPKAALPVADELVAEAPDDFQGYLTRNTVYLVLHDFDKARADNAKALEVFNASKNRYPEKEQNYLLAKIYESFALTALLASRAAPDEDARKRMEAEFVLNAQKVKELDEQTWNNLRGLTGGK